MVRANETPVEEQLKFGDEWVKQWEAEYGVSLCKPNKHYTLSYDNLCIRLKDYLKNIWTVRNFFPKTYRVDCPFIEMNPPLKKQWRSKTWILTSRKITAFHTKELLSLCKSPLIQLLTLFLYFLQGERNENKLNPPERVKVQGSDSGSYRLEQMLQTLKNLPNRNRNPFTKKDWEIYVLDNYAVHIMSEIRKALWDRSYVLVLMGGGITDFIQQNDTHIHQRLKNHRNSESALMIDKLQAKKNKVPSPTQDKNTGLNLKWIK